MEYHIMSSVDPSIWSQFVYNHPHGNIFQTPEMYEVYNNPNNHESVILSVVDEKAEILGILLAVIQKEHSGLVGHFSARSIIHGGPLIKDNNLDTLEFILTEYKKLIKGRAIYSQFRNLWDWGNQGKKVFNMNGYDFGDHLDILIYLNNSEEVLWNKFSRDRKKNIKKSQSFLHVELIDMEEKFDSIYTLLKQVYDRIKLPFPNRSFFYNSMLSFKKNNSLKVFGAYKESTLIGVRLVLCYKRMIYDWYAGADDRYLEYRPNDILPWSVLKWGIENKYDVFDFGGAGKPNVPYGVRDYKLKFGGELVNFGRFELIHNRFIYEIAKGGLYLWKKIR